MKDAGINIMQPDVALTLCTLFAQICALASGPIPHCHFSIGVVRGGVGVGWGGVGVGGVGGQKA